MNRRYMMQEMYQQFLDEDDAWKKVAKDQVRKFAVSSVAKCADTSSIKY